MDDQRLINIESKLAYQEDLLAQLNGALTDQQAQLIKLESMCESLIERMRSLSEAGAPAEGADERPPHY